MSKYHILSIDGGGMKTVISAVVLESLEHTLQRMTNDKKVHIADYFDLIAGTSAGSILASLYLCQNSDGTYQYTASDALQFLLQHGNKVFSNTLCYRLRSLYGLRNSKYQNDNLYKLLQDYLGDRMLADVQKPCLFPSYCLMSGRPFFFNSISAKKSRNVNFLLRDAILSSCSAPTYFPPVQIFSITGRAHMMVDGGLSSNNPALCAFVESMKMPNFTSYKEINILSIGNVSDYVYFPYDKAKNWGILEWAKPLLDIFLTANTTVVDYELQMLYHSFHTRTNYLRIEKKASSKRESPSLDDTSQKAIETFLRIGNELVQRNSTDIEQFAKKLIHSKSDSIV